MCDDQHQGVQGLVSRSRYAPYGRNGDLRDALNVGHPIADIDPNPDPCS